MKTTSTIQHACLLVIVFLLWISNASAQKQEQILGTTSGKYCLVTIEKSNQKENTITFLITAEWINEDLNPIKDTSSVLVLEKTKIKTNDDANIVCVNFGTKEYISTNETLLLEFLLNKKFSSDQFELNLSFDYAPNKRMAENKNKREEFFLKRPRDLAINYSIDYNLFDKRENTPPSIELIYPVINANQKAVVDVSSINLNIRAYDESGINLVMVNSKDAASNNNGTYTTTMNLLPGDNVVTIMATDNDGSISEQKFIIYCNDYSKAAETLLKGGKCYALLIAIENYDDKNINNLDFAIEDAEKLSKTLSEYYAFDKQNIYLLKNPTRSEIIIELDKLSEKVTEKDNVLIFFAGHGYWDDKSSIGYWLPTDASSANKANWFSNSNLRDYISSIKSAHTLLIADACFSGAIFKTRSAFVNTAEAVEKLYSFPSRKAMTSGALQEVPDRSVFVEYLIKRLEENPEIYLSSELLFSSLKTAVVNNSPNIPQFGEISNTGDEGGDFIFIRKKGPDIK
ncbi:MAG: caspase family protein [Bacteroidales bacterium]|nr:caspase family protein [Bacteroidales bacterium]